MKPLAEFVKTHQGKGGDVAFVQHESYLELLNMVDTKVKIVCDSISSSFS